MNRFLEGLDLASRHRDVDVIASYLHPEARFVIEPSAGSTRALDRAQYLEHLRRGFAGIRRYEYARRDTRIQIDRETNVATVRYLLVETLATAERTIRARTQVALTVVPAESGLQVTRMQARVESVQANDS